MMQMAVCEHDLINCYVWLGLILRRDGSLPTIIMSETVGQ